MRSCLKSLLNSGFGRTSQAIVSVIVVNTQFNSPSGVLRSEVVPGISKASSKEMFDGRGFCSKKNLTAILMGVVKQEVKISAGRSGLDGSVSFSRHAARCMQSEQSTGSPFGSR